MLRVFLGACSLVPKFLCLSVAILSGSLNVLAGPGIVTDVQAGEPVTGTPVITNTPPFDTVSGVALSPAGTLYTVGNTISSLFPLPQPVSDTYDNSLVYFLARLNTSGTAYDAVQTFNGMGTPVIAADSAGDVYLAGTASAPTGATVFGPGGEPDVVITKLDSSLSTVLWQVFIGGSGQNGATGLAVDQAGNAYVTGYTNSTGWPVTSGAFQSVNRAADGATGFVAVVAASGSELLRSTYLGGIADDTPRASALGPGGSIYVAGTTGSSDFPGTSGALETTGVGGGFISELSSDGTKLIASTYLAGTDGNSSILALSAGPDSSITAAGTASASFPVTIAGNAPPVGSSSGFVARLNGSLSNQVYGEFIGGAAQVNGVFVDTNNLTYVVGITFGRLTPVRAVLPEFFGSPCTVFTPDGGIQGQAQCSQGFVGELDPSGKVLLSTSLNGYGGLEGATANAVVSDGKGNAFVGGSGVLTFAGAEASQTAGAAFLVGLNVNLTPPVLLAAGVTNAASFASGLPSPGSIATIFCSGLTGIQSLDAPGFPFPLTLEGVTVTVGGIPAPIVALADFGAYQQIDLQVPWGIQYSDIELSQGEVAAWITQPGYATSAPGVFTINGTDGAIQHADYSLVSASNPAQQGEVVLVYATGLGPVATPIATNQLGPTSPPDVTSQHVSVTVAGQSANVLYAGLAPGELAVYQVNIQLPPNLPSGVQELVVSLPPATDQKPPDFSPQQYQRISSPVKIAMK